MQVGGSHSKTVSVPVPEDGVIGFRIQELGISITATLDADEATTAETPVERLGSILMVAPAKRGQPHTITLAAVDAPDITGEVCIRADLLVDSDYQRAEAAYASAGRATHRHDWNAAFDDYLNAARQFDGLDAHHAAGSARRAMAEIAYLRMDKKRESYALAAEAARNLGSRARPFEAGGLLDLQGKALLDMPGVELTAVAPRVRELQASARRLFGSEALAARELPRLDVMAGFLEYRLDGFGRALSLFQKAARTCRQTRDWDCYAVASQDVALLEYEGKNYTVALSTLADALSSLPPGLDRKLAADIWNNFGSLQGLMGLYSSSERSHAVAMREYAQLGDCQGVRRNLARSGNLMAQLGSLSDAKNYLQQAASLDCAGLLATATDPAPGEAMPATPSKPGALHRLSNPRDVAWCSRSLEPASLAIENRLIVFNSLASLGDALMLEGDTAQASRCLDAAGPFAVTAQTRVRLAEARGEVLLESQDAAGARAAFQQSVKIATDAEISPAYEYRGLAQLGLVKAALLARDSAGVLRDGLPALEASVSRGDINQTVTALRLLASGYRELGQRDAAARTLQTAADLIEAVPINELDGEKRATYLATQHGVFAELTDLYATEAAHDPAMASLAFATSERGRSRSLRYAVTQSEKDVASDPDRPAATRYQQLLQEVVHLTSSQGEGAHAELIENLRQAAQRERKSETPLDEKQLVATLGQLGASLVEYAVGERDMFAFVLNANGLQVIRLGNERRIAEATTQLHDRLLDPEAPASEIRELSGQLARLTLWPLTAHLTGKRLIFVPDDGLHTVPFNLLPWSDQPSDQLLLHHAEVSIAPSALFLTRLRANNTQHSNAPRIELLGDPVFRISDWQRECTDAAPASATAHAMRTVADWTESLPRLTGSRAEVQTVARLSQQWRPGSHIETLLGCAAVPTALRRAANGRVDLLHIATHARVDSQRPRLSALALTPERRADGTASAFGLLDILGLKLDSGLVVLSACETSRGRLLPGEGVLGPAQAFLQAGAGAVLASYWRVDDLETSQFMQVFYKYLLAERLPAATALRRAQLETAAATRSHNWAAFALYGWPDSSI